MSVDNQHFRAILGMRGNEIHWGKGSAYNLGRIPGSSVRVERYQNQHGWSYLISNDKLTYLFAATLSVGTKDELDAEILRWIAVNKKLTI